MAQIIDDRERRIAASNRRLQNLLDHMGQAILVFDSRGKLTEEHSREAARIFGATAGSSVVDQVYPDAEEALMEREAFQAWIDAAVTAGDSVQFKELVELAPRSVKLRRAGSELELALEYRLVDGGNAQQIMLLATDVTEQRRLERSVAEKEREHERQLSAVRRLVSGGGQLFAAFLEHTQRRLAVCRELLDAHPTLDRGTVEALFQQFHTLRAEARCFDLTRIEARVTELEALLQELRAGDTDHEGSQDVRRGVEELAQLSTEAEQTFVAQHPLGVAALDQITVRRSRLVRLLELSGTLEGNLGSRIAELARRPLVESTALLPEAVARWAQRAGKQVRLEVDHRGLEIPYALSSVLGGVLSHLLRNAIAHGIETEAERAKAGKPSTGVVRISGMESDGGVAITVSDDGAGFNIDAIRAQVGGASREAILALSEAFESGTSTILNRGELAGAGVGLAAARAELAAAGYRIKIASTSRQGTELRLAPISGSDAAPVSTGLAARNA